MNISINKRLSIKIVGLILFYALISTILALTLNPQGIIWGGDDAPFHIGRLISLNYSFEHGNFIPSISNSNFRQIGYGIHLFYPWVTIAPIAWLFSIFKNPVTAFYTGIGIYFFCSFFISHLTMKKFSNSTVNAVVFSLFYNLSNYLLIEVLPRTDIAEFIATILLPVCFLGFYNVFFGDFHKWKTLAIGMSGLLLTHLLSTVIVSSFSLIILLFYVIKSNHFWARFKSLLKAVIMTICASAIFLMPFLSEVTFQSYAQPSPYHLRGKVLEKMVQASLANSSIQSANGNTYNLGVVLLVALILGLVFFYKFSPLYQRIYVLSFLAFFMTTDVFPWDLFQDTPIRVIQFPFRFLMVATLLTAVIAARLVMILIERFSFKVQLPVILLLTTVLCGLWISSAQVAQTQKMISKKSQVITSQEIHKKSFYEDYYEQYSPASASKFMPSTIWHIGKINREKIIFHPKADGESIVFKTGVLLKNTVVELPIVRYQNTRLTINGKPTNITTSKNGTVKVKLSKKISHPVFRTTYQTTNLALFSAALSLVAWIYLLLGLGRKKSYKWSEMEQTLRDIEYN